MGKNIIEIKSKCGTVYLYEDKSYWDKGNGIGISISMDGKGRAIDNVFVERLWRSVKYEHVYLHVYDNGTELWDGLNRYFWFYNHERLHQCLDYRVLVEYYRPQKSISA